jgi:hypothetical protein
MRTTVLLVSLAAILPAQQAEPEVPRLKTREELTAPKVPGEPKDLWVLAAGTRIPIALRQPISTKSAQPGDPIYAQTTFPIVVDSEIVVPAGTWVQGKVDNVKRAGRLKGTAELQFHLTSLIYSNGYTLDIAAAIDRVPGDESSTVVEPGKVAHNSEKGKDLERVGDAASKGGQIGAIAGTAAKPGMRGFGVGGLAGVAGGTLIGLLARGTDVRFDTGTAVEIALSRPMAIEAGKASRIPTGVPR